jgi:hypothetical protein
VTIVTYEKAELSLVGVIDEVVLGPTLTPPSDNPDEGFQGVEIAAGLDA